MKRWILIENEHGEEELLPYDLETEGTTAEVGRGFKWMCFCCLVAVAGILLMSWFLLELIWG